MKKNFYILLMFLFFAITITSCKKNYSCSCEAWVTYYSVTPDNQGGGSGIGPDHYIHRTSIEPINSRLTKKQAISACESTEKSLSVAIYDWFRGPGYTYVRNLDLNCDIK